MKKRVICLLCVMALATGCSHLGAENDPPDTHKWLFPHSAEYEQILSYADSHVPCISDFRRVYPRSRVMIFPSFPKHPASHVVAQTLVYGRYYVQLSQRIRTSKEALSATPIGSPVLRVSEIDRLEGSPTGGWFTVFGANQHSFGSGKWQRLRDARGDLSAIMRNVTKDRPLSQAEEYLGELESR